MFCFFKTSTHAASGQRALPLVFTSGLAFLVPALLPGVKLRHDRVFCSHDLEGPDRPHGQREPDRGGAEVGPTGGRAAVLTQPA